MFLYSLYKVRVNRKTETNIRSEHLDKIKYTKRISKEANFVSFVHEAALNFKNIFFYEVCHNLRVLINLRTKFKFKLTVFCLHFESNVPAPSTNAVQNAVEMALSEIAGNRR